MIGNAIANNIGALILAAIKNISNLGKFLVDLAKLAGQLALNIVTNLVKALGRGLEECAEILSKFFGAAFDKIKDLLTDAYHAAAQLVNRALRAIGDVIEDVGRAIVDFVDEVGDFFSGLFGGYSTARLLKKLSLIGKQLDDVEAIQRQVRKKKNKKSLPKKKFAN